MNAFDEMESDERWLGFGYLGERRHALDDSDPESPARPELVQQADDLVLKVTASMGWTHEDLFHWANSKPGRWLGDIMLSPGEKTNADWNRAVLYLYKVDA